MKHASTTRGCPALKTIKQEVHHECPKYRKRVRFADEIDLVPVFKILEDDRWVAEQQRQQYSRRKNEDIWYTSNDYLRMRKREAVFTRHLSVTIGEQQLQRQQLKRQHNRPLDCVDGVESIQFRKARRERQNRSILSVLLEQEKYWSAIEKLEADLLEASAEGCHRVPRDDNHAANNVLTKKNKKNNDGIMKCLNQVYHNRELAIAKCYARNVRESRKVAFEMGTRLAKQVKDVLNRAQNDQNNDDGYSNEFGSKLNGGGLNKRYQQPTLSNLSEDSESTIDSHEEYQIHQGLVPQLE
eukprot:CAMPEP_0113483308 /NCGR_PEP_ID=MMETSP0014_2-20120614/23367_1 /TAXON_ID=2857 /ORGANISM="Nitzschia sp." /LENGTH=297 /DNA_ID=CAMNT_0000376851 /DNA_START=209 /DNA_END=1102 /DNA_ORIENTATION=+ /assembly_acc=CAM_ASM_000159